MGFFFARRTQKEMKHHIYVFRRIRTTVILHVSIALTQYEEQVCYSTRTHFTSPEPQDSLTLSSGSIIVPTIKVWVLRQTHDAILVSLGSQITMV